MSIPILWQDPFSFSFNKTNLLISNYFSSLDEDQKLALKEHGINVEFSKTLFDYAIFLKVLDLDHLRHTTIFNYLKHFIPALSFEDPSTEFIFNLLFKLLIESGATLHKLVLLAPRFIEIKPDIIKSFEQNAQFFSQLQDLTIDIESFLSIENTIALLNIFIKHTTKISSLKLGGIFSNHEPQLFHILIRFIKSQEQLRKFCFAGEHYHTNFNGLLSALESQKNSLQEVIVENYGYSAEFDVLKICKNLETLRMRNEFDYPILFLNCKISTLEIYSFKIDGSTIVQILEHSGNLLQRLKLNNNDFKILNEFLLLEAIKSFCPNITYLSISKIGFSTQILEIIGNLQKLQFLTLKFFVDISEKELKIRVKQFAEILPLTLQYLDLINNSWLMPYLDIFLNHCNVPLNKLSIYQLDNEKNIEALIEFCKRNRTLNYFSMFDHWKLDKSFTKKLEAYTALESYDRFVVHC